MSVQLCCSKIMTLLHTFSSSAPSRRSHFSLLISSSCHSGQTRNPGINCWLSDPAGDANLKQWFIAFLYVDSSLYLTLFMSHMPISCFRDDKHPLNRRSTTSYSFIYLLSVIIEIHSLAVLRMWGVLFPWLTLGHCGWYEIRFDWCQSQCCFSATLCLSSIPFSVQALYCNIKVSFH